jgi:hydroxypyruvate isomerase
MATAWDAGARGTLCLAGQDAAFRAGLQQALEYASVLQPARACDGRPAPAGQSHAGVQALVTERLHWAAQQARDAGVALLIEPINGRDMPATTCSARTRRMRWCRPWIHPGCRCRWTCTTARSSKAMWP